MKQFLMLSCILACGTAGAAPSGAVRCDKLLDVNPAKPSTTKPSVFPLAW
ncbi:MAG: hypothetical protein WDN04_05950 [Rhodospirillales bacterium]